MLKIAVIVLNWNSIKDTLLCLNSLLDQDYSNFQILVVENGSSDNSATILKDYEVQHSNRVKVIYNSNNLGFAGGVNTGIRWSLDNGYDAIALLNNDAVADRTWLKQLASTLNDRLVGVSTGLLLSSDGKTIDSSGEQYSNWGLPFPRSRNDKTVFAPGSGLVFGATGGATLYRTEVFKDIGLFDEDFFAYYEDVDISFRAQLAGWKVKYNSDAIAYHKRGASSEKIPGFTVKQTFKNLPWLYIKNIPRGLMIFVGARFPLAYILMFGNAIKNGAGWPALQGLVISIVKTPKKIGERFKIQRNKKVSASYIRDLLWDDLPPDQAGLRKLRSFFIRNR